MELRINHVRINHARPVPVNKSSGPDVIRHSGPNEVKSVVGKSIGSMPCNECRRTQVGVGGGVEL